MNRLARLALALALGAAPVLVAMPAGAAGPESPRYVTSDPGDGAEVDSAPSRVTVTFSEPLDSSSTLHVYDECGTAVDAGDTQVLGSRMDVGIARSPSGHYTAVYLAKGFGGATGETKDDFSFHVASGSPCGGASAHHHHGGGEEGHGGHEGGHDDHSGHEGSHSGHSGTSHEGHSGHEGTSHSGHETHAGHDAHGAGHTDHAAGEHHHHGGVGLPGVTDLTGKGSGDGEDGDAGRGLVPPRLAAGGGAGGLAPTGRSVLIALGLSMALGALGGWVLRASASTRGAVPGA